ncbi:proline--tRNA ligase [Candidatus Micrarchaeota archaeon]|nr:proline--tRNA ligase [Candidatus Micrarchaeota archaeon]
MQSKKENFSEWYSEVVKEAQLADLRYNVKGFLVHRPNSVLAMKKMYSLYEKALEDQGHKPVWFPAIIPEANFLKESEHVAGFTPQVMWVTHGGSEELEQKMALRPTSETAFYQMFNLWIQGLVDLPLKLYQSCQVWRHETKATRPFIRGREFHWIETHDVFATEKEAKAQVKQDMKTTEKVMHQQFGIPFIFFRRPQWDKFPGADDTFAADSLMPDGKAIQQPSTHMLGTHFTKAFDVKFQNEKGENVFPYSICYGPCIWRMLASVIALHGDDKGLVFPYKIAPVQIAIVPILKAGADNQKLIEYAKKLGKKLSKKGVRAQVDVSEQTAGSKYYYWELRGAALRVEIGQKELAEGKLTIARRDTGLKEQLTEKQFLAKLREYEKQIRENLVSKADAWFANQMHEAKTMDELKQSLGKGGFTRVPLCSDEMTGKQCADRIKAELSGDVRGVRADKKEKPSGEQCVACGKKAKEFAYAARQY